MTESVMNEDSHNKKKKKKFHNSQHAKNACYGKIQHRSMLAAQYILNRMNGKNSHLLEIYKCPFCKTFHIGHNRLLEQKNKPQSSV